MKLPEYEAFEFSPLAWKEWLHRGDKSDFRSKRDIYAFLKRQNREATFEWCNGIENSVKNRRIRSLLNGYTILDLLNEEKTVEFTKFKMWRLFEDTVVEILREAIKEKEECTVAYVDRWSGFKGLDYIIINSGSKLGWKVGVQCKRYVGTRIPYCRVNEYSSYSRGVSASNLYDKGIALKERYTDKRKVILFTFSAYRKKKIEKRRFDWLRSAWDSVIVFDKNTEGDCPYTYKLHFDELDKIVRWC